MFKKCFAFIALFIPTFCTGQIKLLKTITVKGAGDIFYLHFDKPATLGDGTFVYKEKKEERQVVEIGIGPATTTETSKEPKPTPPKVPYCVQTKNGKKTCLQPDEQPILLKGNLLCTYFAQKGQNTVIRKYEVNASGIRLSDSLIVEIPDVRYVSVEDNADDHIFWVSTDAKSRKDTRTYTIWNKQLKQVLSFKDAGYNHIALLGHDSISVTNYMENTRSTKFSIYAGGRIVVEKNLEVSFRISTLYGSSPNCIIDGYIFTFQQYDARTTHIIKYDRNLDKQWQSSIGDDVESFTYMKSKHLGFASNRSAATNGQQSLTLFDIRNGEMIKKIDYRSFFSGYLAKHKDPWWDVLPLMEVVSPDEQAFMCTLHGYSPSNSALHIDYLFITDGKKTMTCDLGAAKDANILIHPLPGRKVIVTVNNTVKLFSY